MTPYKVHPTKSWCLHYSENVSLEVRGSVSASFAAQVGIKLTPVRKPHTGPLIDQSFRKYNIALSVWLFTTLHTRRDSQVQSAADTFTDIVRACFVRSSLDCIVSGWNVPDGHSVVN